MDTLVHVCLGEVVGRNPGHTKGGERRTEEIRKGRIRRVDVKERRETDVREEGGARTRGRLPINDVEPTNR